MTNRIFSTKVAQASIRSRNASPPVVAHFQFNPEKISDRRRITYAEVDAPGQVLPFPQYVKGGERSLSFSIEVSGALASNRQCIQIGDNGDISGELGKYRALVYPESSAWRTAGFSHAASFGQTRQFRAPPICVLSLGVRALDCILTDLTIDETMFNAELKPVAAILRLTVKEIVPYGGPSAETTTGAVL